MSRLGVFGLCSGLAETEIVTATSGSGGVSAFTFVSFLTATAVDEMWTEVGGAVFMWTDQGPTAQQVQTADLYSSNKPDIAGD